MKIFCFNYWSVFSKIVLLIVVILLPVFIVLRIYIFPLIAENSINHEKEALRNLVESVISQLKSYDEKVKDGTLTLDGAKKIAAAEINKIRYSNQRYYFGIDKDGNLVIPKTDSINTKNEEANITDKYRDKIINDIINMVKIKGSGYLGYNFYKPGGSELIRKISYIGEFRPWGWYIGTGFYLDEIESNISAVQRKIIIPLILTAIFAIVLAFIISRVILLPIKKLTNTALDIARGHFENTVDIHQYDEIGILAKAFNSLINSFKGFSAVTKIAKIGFWEWKVADKYVIPGNIIHEIYGFPEGELIRYDDMIKMICESDSSKVKNSIENIMNGGTPDFIEFKIIRTDGQIRDILGTHVIIKNEKNELMKLIGFNIDITEKKKNEKDIYSLLDFQNKILDTTKVWINTIDTNGNVTLWNKAAEEISGYKKEEVLGHSEVFKWLFPDKDYSALIYPKYEVLPDEHKPPEDIITDIISKDGNTRTISWKTNYLTDENNACIGCLALGFEVTENIRTERELKNALSKAEEANKLKSVLLSNMSHELRTPMNGILGFSGILKTELNDMVMKSMADKIYESSTRLMNTFDSILNLAELESGLGKYAEVPIDLVVCVSSIMSEYEKKARDKNLRIILQVEDSNITVLSEEVLLKRMLSNLLDNAIKFTNKGEIILVIDSEKHEGRDFAVIRVKDNGIGINLEHLEEIFMDFKQVSQGLDRHYEGNGLGLAIARKTARLLGGDIKVESKYGIGSVFSILLPGLYLKDFDGKTEKKEPMKSDTDINPQQPLVLLVEDNIINQEIVSIYLEGSYIVDTAEDGNTAIKMASEKKYAAILMDVNLGEGIDGVTTAVEIKKDDMNSDTPIIAVTGYTPSNLDTNFRNNICDGYLLKPFEKEDLKDLLEKLVNIKNN